MRAYVVAVVMENLILAIFIFQILLFTDIIRSLLQILIGKQIQKTVYSNLHVGLYSLDEKTECYLKANPLG